MEIKLNNTETELIKALLKNVVVRSRTGELGIFHGADRFVSTNTILKKPAIMELEKLFIKLGLSEIKKFDK